MRIHRGVLRFAIIASRSAQGLPPTTSDIADRTILFNATLPQKPTNHADRGTRDTHMYTCPNGVCTYSASPAAQTKGRVPIPLMLAGAGLAAVLGSHYLAIPLAIVAFSDSAMAETIPPLRAPTPEVPTTLTSLSLDVEDGIPVYVTPVSLTAASTSDHELSNRATAPAVGTSYAPMDSLACTGDSFLVCSHGGTWTNTGSMGSNYVCEDENPTSSQCANDTPADGPASGTAGQNGASSKSGAPKHSAAPTARRGRSIKLLLTGALAAALHGHVLALPVTLLALLQPAIAAAPSPGSAHSPTSSLIDTRIAPRASCSDIGALSCGDGGNTFFLCSEGTLVDMGHVAAGTVCVNGGIAAAPGYDGAGAGAGIESAARGRGAVLPLLVGGLVVGVMGSGLRVER